MNPRREILFRGKRLDNGEWVEGFYVGANISAKYHEIFDPAECLWHRYVVDPSTVGQYTGLKDKNRVKIFEGDVCTVDSEDGLFIIEWSDDSAMFRIEGDGLSLDFDNFCPEELEVVGNIHDNPELLENE